MDLDKNWFESDSAMEVYETMRAKEETMPNFSKESSFILRRETVNWMIKVAEGFRHDTQKLSFSNRTIHLAVYLFDFFIEHRDPPLGSVLIVAAAALIVAAKFEEESKFTAKASIAIASVMSSLATMKEIRLQEQDILSEIEFELLVPTSVTYVPYFIAFSNGQGSIGTLCDHKECDHKLTTGHHPGMGYLYLPETYFTDGKYREQEFLKCEYFDSLVYFFCRIAMKGTTYWQFKQSVIASSALAAARFVIGAAPTWPSSMASLTKLTIGELTICIGLMLNDFDSDRETPTLFPQFDRSCFAIDWFKCTTSVFTPGSSNCMAALGGTETPVPASISIQPTGTAMVLNRSDDEVKPVLFFLLNKPTSGLGMLAEAASLATHLDEQGGKGRPKRMKVSK